MENMARAYYTLLLLCLMVHASAAGDPQHYCPEGGWHLAGGACFMLTEPMSWYEARDYCQKLPKANLAFFDSRAQFKMAISTVSMEPTWIGLYGNSPRVDRDYIWTYHRIGQTLPPDFIFHEALSSWGENEPSLGSDSCASIVKGASAAEGGWQDDPCYMKQPFICQKEKGETGCGQGWFVDTQTDICYFHSGLIRHTWFKSKDYCTSDHSAKLASPNTKRANNFIISSVMPQAGSAWIGLWDKNMNDRWEWFDPVEQVNWTNWRAGQPDNGGRLPRHCVTLGCGKPGGWLRDHCTSHYPFICEMVTKESTANCPGVWIEGAWNGSRTPKRCFKTVPRRSTWEEARQTCKDLGADLVTMDTQEKATWVKETFLSQTEQCAGHRWWIGLNSLHEGLRWTWLDTATQIKYYDWQTDPSFPYGDPSLRASENPSHWDLVYDYYDAVDTVAGALNGQSRTSKRMTYPAVNDGATVGDYWDPSDPEWKDDDYNKYKEAERLDSITDRLHHHALTGDHYEDKAVLMLTVNTFNSIHHICEGCWLNVPYTAIFAALCEIDHGDCVENGHLLQHKGHCYKVLPPAPWSTQLEECRNVMGDGTSFLAVIDTKEEQDYLTGELKGKPEASPGVHIGLNAFEKPYHFRWLINDKIYANVTTTSTYTHWGHGEPHRHPSHRCVMAAPNHMNSMMWSDANCLVPARAMCRRNPLNASVYYDFKLRDSIYKVTHQRVAATTDFKLLCSELLGEGAHLVYVNSLAEYHVLPRLLHYEFSGGEGDLWIGNVSRMMIWSSHYSTPPKPDAPCPPVLNIMTALPHIGKGDCCVSRYALCERTIKGSSGLYDVRVGNKLYRFVTSPTDISYGDADRACRNMTQGYYGRLLSISSPEQYVKLSAEMRVLDSPQNISQYWISKSLSWMEYAGSDKFVVRSVDRLAKGAPCLVASIGQDISRRLTQHDYLHIQPEECDKLMRGYICQSELSLTQIRTEHTVLRRIFEDMFTKYFRFNATAFKIGLRPKVKAAIVATPEPPPACGPACVALAVLLPIMCIVFFIIGFLVARFCRKSGYHLMISPSRRHRMDEMDIPFTTST